MPHAAQNMGILRGAMSTLYWILVRRQSTFALDAPNMMSDSPNARISIHPYHPIPLIRHSKTQRRWTVPGRLKQSDHQRPALLLALLFLVFPTSFFFYVLVLALFLAQLSETVPARQATGWGGLLSTCGS